MAERNNPYSLKVELNEETESVDVTVREKDDKGEFQVVETETFPLSDVTDPIIAMKERLYGRSKLLQDRSSDTPTGPGKLAAMREVNAQLAEGKWEKERQAGAPTVSAEVEALAQLKDCTVADIQKSLRKYTKEQKEKVLSNPKVTELAAKIRKSREATPEIDLLDLAETA